MKMMNNTILEIHGNFTPNKILSVKYLPIIKYDKGTKTKEKVAVDIERVNSINELVETVITNARL